MNEQEQPSVSTDTNETQNTTSESAEASAVTPEETATAATTERKKWPFYIAAVVVVVALLLAVLYVLEKEGRSETSVFTWLIEAQEAGAVVATVNGVDITGAELSTSIEQFSQVAVAQGVDANDPAVQADIRTQALEVLINTELLKQAAAEVGLSVSEDATAARLEEITVDIGGEEILAERMQSLGVDEASLVDDIRDELLIDQYLDLLFSEADMNPSDEAVQEFYDAAGGAEAGLPPLEEVRSEIENQITVNAEQELIDQALSELRAEAEIVTE